MIERSLNGDESRRQDHTHSGSVGYVVERSSGCDSIQRSVVSLIVCSDRIGGKVVSMLGLGDGKISIGSIDSSEAAIVGETGGMASRAVLGVEVANEKSVALSLSSRLIWPLLKAMRRIILGQPQPAQQSPGLNLWDGPVSCSQSRDCIWRHRRDQGRRSTSKFRSGGDYILRGYYHGAHSAWRHRLSCD